MHANAHNFVFIAWRHFGGRDRIATEKYMCVSCIVLHCAIVGSGRARSATWVCVCAAIATAAVGRCQLQVLFAGVAADAVGRCQFPWRLDLYSGVSIFPYALFGISGATIFVYNDLYYWLRRCERKICL